MKAFSQLFTRLDSSNSINEKVAAVREYFQTADAKDAAWALFFLLGNKLKGTLGTRVFAQTLQEASGYPEWLIDECYSAVGDFAETAALLLPPPRRAQLVPLHYAVEHTVLPTIRADVATQRRLLLEAWQSMEEHERLVLHKLIRGSFRVGVQRKLVVRALAELAGIAPSTIEARLTGSVPPTPEAYLAVISAEPLAIDRHRPYPFMLANPLPPAHMHSPAEFLGDASPWQVEWKYDGTRAQIIHRDNDVLVWSRGEEVINVQFPRIVALARRLPDGTVLDTELLAWEGDRPLPFAALQRHLNRKTAKSAQTTLFDKEHIVAVAFDILEHAGRDVRALPLRERRVLLESVVRALDDESLRIAPLLQAPTWEQLFAQRSTARQLGAEGLMLKHADSPYVLGRSRTDTSADQPAGWWKWKLDPYSVDAVLVYAQPGSGRRAGLFTDYTFALWQVDERGGRLLVPFAKAYSGLTQEEIESVDAFVRKHTLSKAGPVRMVSPQLVFEIGFEGLQESTRYKSGIAVRFPRMLKWRHDKPASDADTLEALRKLLPEHGA